MISKKRNLFAELEQGIKDIDAHKAGKITLRNHPMKKLSRLHIDAQLIRELREHLNMSRNIFARKLRVSARTLEKWEQGETAPNDQAAALILMVKKYPDTLQRLEKL